MIDTSTEEILSLSQAAEQLPRRRRGCKTHVSCLYRWTTSGCRGIVLESIQIGATRATSKEALQRFYERLSAPSEPSERRTVAASQRASEAAERELKNRGV